MIDNLGQIMLYVNNQEEIVEFWTEKVGFAIISEDSFQDQRWYELAPTKESQTSIVIHNKEIVAKSQPQLNLGTPSLMFYAENLDQLYKDFQDKNITVGELVELPFGKVFNFADTEQNYFAIMEKSKSK